MKNINYFRMFLTVLAVTLFTGMVSSAYTSEIINLSGSWLLHESNKEEFPGEKETWKAVTVPGYLTGYKYQFSWFKRDFTVSSEKSGEKVFMRFDGVKWSTEVFINGKSVGGHNGGFEPFELDITDFIKWDGVNNCVVKVSNLNSVFDPASKKLLYPPGWHRDINLHGIWGNVEVAISPPVCIKEVSVFTLMREKTISVRAYVDNGSSKPVNLSMLFRISDGYGEQLIFRSTPEILMPGEKKQLTTVSKWQDPHLWWPHDPYLYNLESVVEVEGKEVHRKAVTFGFREFRIDGNQFSFNGKRIHLRGACFHVADVYDHLDPASSERTYELLKYANVNCVRLMDQPWPRHWYETADRMGMLVVEDTAITPDGGQAIYDERFWRNAGEHLEGVIKRDINSPSIIIWNLTNEIDSLLMNNKTMDKNKLEAKVIELKNKANILDPMRPVMNEGALIFGKGDIENIHYPREYVYDLNMGGDNYQYPNIAHWFILNRSGSLRKDASIPYFIGETLWAPSRTPDGDSVFIGDEGYKNFVKNKVLAKAKAWLIQLKAYRFSDIPAVTPWNLFEEKPWGNGWKDRNIPSKNPLIEACREAFSPVAAFMKEYNSRFFSGTEFSRAITIFNDLLEDKKLQIDWELSLEGKTIRAAKRELFFEAGSKDIIIAATYLPDVEERSKLKFNISISDGKEVLFSDSYDYYLFPFPDFKNLPGVPAGVYDPENSLSAIVKIGRLKNIKQLNPEELAGLTLLIIGEKVFSGSVNAQADVTDAVHAFVERGGSVIVMKQGTEARGIFPLTLTNHSPTMCYIRAKGHSVFEGIEEEDLSFWSKNNIVASNCYLKPQQFGARALVDAGGEGGLLYSPLIEVVSGRGKILFCQMNIAEKIREEPAAAILFRNMMKYCLEGYDKGQSTHIPSGNDISSGNDTTPPLPSGERTKVRGILLSGSDTFKQKLQSTGFNVDDYRNKDFPGMEGGNNVFIFDDFNEVSAVFFDKAQSLIKEGSILYIHGITPEGFEMAKDRFLKDYSISKPVRNLPFLRGISPLLWGISNQELYWTEDKSIAAQYILPLRPRIISYALIKDGEEKSSLMFPSGLIEIPYGKGKIVIDQLNWDSLPDGSSAWKNARRYVAVLFTNFIDFF